MRILVTGSSGMIGTALVTELLKAGHSVVGLDIVPAKDASHTCVLHDLRTPIPAEKAALIQAEPVDLIVHLAANARVYQLVLDPSKALDNIMMEHHILEFARTQNIKKYMFASSRETYGNGNQLPVPETVASQRRCESIYTASKITGEAYCYAYHYSYGIDARIIRFSNVYGRYDFSDRFIPKAIRYLQAGKTFSIYGAGKTLDFTYLDDAVTGVITLINTWDKHGDVIEYNIAYGEQANLYDVAVALKDILKSPSEVVVAENLVGEVMNYQADITRMKKLGWSPTTKLQVGLEKAVHYYTEDAATIPITEVVVH